MHEDQLTFFFSYLPRTPIEQDHEIEAVPLTSQAEPSENQSEALRPAPPVDIP